MESGMGGSVQAKIDALDDEIQTAQNRSDPGKAQALYEKQASLYRMLPGGRDPVVGTSGGPNA